MRITSRLYFPENAPCPQVLSSECRNRIDKLEAELAKLQGGAGVEFSEAKASFFAVMSKHALSESVADGGSERSRMLLEEAKDETKWAILASLVKEENELKAKIYNIEATIRLAEMTWEISEIYTAPEPPKEVPHISLERKDERERLYVASLQGDERREWDRIQALLQTAPDPYEVIERLARLRDEELAEQTNNEIMIERLARLRGEKPHAVKTNLEVVSELYERLVRLRDNSSTNVEHFDLDPLGARVRKLKEDPDEFRFAQLRGRKGPHGIIPDPLDVKEFHAGEVHTGPRFTWKHELEGDDDFELGLFAHMMYKLNDRATGVDDYQLLRLYDEDFLIEQSMKEYLFDYNDRSEASLLKLANCMDIGKSPFDLMIQADHTNTLLHLRNPLALHLSLVERSQICEENIKELKSRLKRANEKIDTYLRKYGSGGSRVLKRDKKYDILTEYLRVRAGRMVTDTGDSAKFKKTADEAKLAVAVDYQKLTHVLNMSEIEEMQSDEEFVSEHAKDEAAKKGLASELDRLTSEWTAIEIQTSERLSELGMEIRELESLPEKDDVLQSRITALKSHLNDMRRNYDFLQRNISDHKAKVTDAMFEKIDVSEKLQARTMARKVLKASYEKYKNLRNQKSKRADIFQSLDQVFVDFNEYKKLRFIKKVWVELSTTQNAKYMSECTSLANQTKELSEYVIMNHEARIEEVRRKKAIELARQANAKLIQAAETEINHTNQRAERATKRAKNAREAKDTGSPGDLAKERDDINDAETWNLEAAEYQQRKVLEEMRLKIEEEFKTKLDDTVTRNAELVDARERELKVATEKLSSAELRGQELEAKIAELETQRNKASVESLKEAATLTAEITLMQTSQISLQKQREGLIISCRTISKKYRELMRQNQTFLESVQVQLEAERAYVKKLEQNGAVMKKRNTRYAREFAAQRLVVSELKSRLQSLQNGSEVRESALEDARRELREADAALVILADSHTHDVNQLQLENEAVVSELNAEKTKLKETERELKQLQAKLGAEREANLLLRNALIKSENQVRSLELSILKMSEENRDGKVELERRLDSARNDVSRLEERVRKYENLVRENRDVMGDKSLEIGKLQQDAIRDRKLLEEAQTERSLLQKKLQTEQERFEQQAVHMDHAIAEKTILETRLVEIEAKYEHAKQADDNLRRIQQELGLSETEKEAMRTAMETAAAEASRDVGVLQSDLKRASETAGLLQLEQTRVRNELAEKTRLYDSSVTEGSKLRTTIVELEQQIRDSAVSVDGLQRKLEEQREASLEGTSELRAQLTHEIEVSNSTQTELAKVNADYAAISLVAQQHEAKAREMTARIHELENNQQAASLAASAIKVTLETKLQATLDKCAGLEATVLSLTRGGVAHTAERTRVVALLAQLRQEQSAKDKEWELIKNSHVKTVGELTASVESWKKSAERSVREIQILQDKSAASDGSIKQLQKELTDTKVLLQKAEEQARLKERQNIQLKNDLRERDSQITKLKSIVDVGNKELQSSLEEKAAAERDLVRAKMQLAFRTIALGRANGAVLRSRGDIEAVHKQLKESEGRVENLEEKCKTLQTEQEEKQKRIATLEEQAALGDAQLNTAAVMVYDLRTHIEQLNVARSLEQAEMEKMQVLLHNMQQEYQNTVDGITGEATDAVLQLQAAVVGLEQTVAAKNAEIAEKQAHLSASLEANVGWQAKCDSLRAEKTSLTEQLHMDRIELAQHLKEKDTEITKLNAEITKLNAHVRDNATAYTGIQLELTKYKQDVAQKELELKTTETKMGKLKDELTVMKEQLIQEQVLRTQAETNLNALNEGWQTRLSDIIAKHKTLTESLQNQVHSELTQRIELQREAGRLKSEHESLQSTLQEQRLQYDELTKQKQETEKMYNSTLEQVANLEQQQKEKMEENKRLKGELYTKRNIEQQLQEAQRIIGADSIELDKRGKEIVALSTKIKELESRNSKNETLIENLTNELSEAKSKSIATANKLRAATEAYKQQQGIVAEREREIVQLKASMAIVQEKKTAQEAIIRNYESERTTNRERLEMLINERGKFITTVLELVGSKTRPDDSSVTIETAAVLYAEYVKSRDVTNLESELRTLRIALADCETGKGVADNDLKKCRQDLKRALAANIGTHSKYDDSVLRDIPAVYYGDNGNNSKKRRK